MANAIETKKLTKVFGDRKALDKVSIEVPEGAFLSIFGPNGAGKTTLVRTLATLSRATSGTALVAGFDAKEEPDKVREHIGLISHNPMLYPDLTAMENLMFTAQLYGVVNAEERVRELLRAVELDHRRFDVVRTFSRGMTQRLSIARALMNDPDVVFLDEPYAGLDPHAVEIFDGLIEQLRDATTVPLFLGVDEEGGLVARLANNAAFGLPKYESAAAVGASGNPADAENMGRTIGGYLADYGFTVDFAPVADVYTNPANTVIGSRAFSADANTAAAMAGACARGLASQGVLPVYKHFPGHGDTAEDSHNGLAVTYKTHDELAACEWIPYSANDLTGCAVMVGHIAAPNVTGDLTPASLSGTMITGYLRGELGFTGLVITDSMAMHGVTDAYSSGDAAIAAIEAGVDIILMPEVLSEAFDAVAAAVENGTISEARLNESVYRVLQYKQLYGIFNP